MSNIDMNQAMAAFAQLFASAMGQAQGQAPQGPAAVPSVETPEIAAQRTKKVERLRAYGAKVADDLWEVLRNFDAMVVIQIAAGMQWKAASQYFWSIDGEERAVLRHARQLHRGARHQSGMEIDEVRDEEQAILFHRRNAEQYETLNFIAEQLWLKADHELARQGQEAPFVPNFELNEGARRKWQEGRDRMNRSKPTPDATHVQGARIERETHNDFLDGVLAS
jgi:hypothetical protein